MKERTRRTPPPELGPLLARYRRQRRLSYRQAAKRIGISFGYLCELEHGRRSPSYIVASAIMAAYRIEEPHDRQVLVVAAVDDAGRNWEPDD